MKPSVNARPVGFRFQLADVVVRVSRVGDSAAYRKSHIRRAKEILQRLGYRAGGTSMSSGDGASGSQAGSATVSGFPSISPFGIAVTGRQLLK